MSYNLTPSTKLFMILLINPIGFTVIAQINCAVMEASLPCPVWAPRLQCSGHPVARALILYTVYLVTPRIRVHCPGVSVIRGNRRWRESYLTQYYFDTNPTPNSSTLALNI
ncbi:hypothetical protein NEUTE1DRAFT_109623 [Neurospora tetrasperma FGSC 2508]|uniref:Uncharacterized protein n=1 Tax=Neurospora tetrasperma (strain FGSC 2508 / ATCC MYA-4615 / P0657) TaxID=510951 RepID=F8MK86_NEUT8|nr:uncharacterized protein NEUTE1DRAFT_109623 [Neurospora tetrasperma FGSC 2508]EGO57370.1 hypothetical protein NEUTE1DRAFT_109623 [Neurospora tetrasperma FGSC 2508]